MRTVPCHRGTSAEFRKRPQPGAFSQPRNPGWRHLAKHSRQPDALAHRSTSRQTRQSHAEYAINGRRATRVADVPGEPALTSWLCAIDHKRVGKLYMLSALVFFLAGGMEAMVMRAQLAAPNLRLITPETYNQVFTMHGTTMIFLVAMPVLTGFGVYLVPLMIGANEMALPRLGALSFWLQFFGGLLLYFSFATGAAPAAGWFSYAPFSEKPFSPGPGTDYWALALLMITAGSLSAAVNLIVTVATERAPGMTMRLVPLFVWSTFIASIMVVFALPALAAALVLLLSDRLLFTAFFDPANGGSPLLWQHYFWIFGPPEVYIVVLPAFGMISEIIPVFSRKPIFGYPFVATSTVAIAFLSYGVWVHHMFAVALGRNFLAVFAAA